jgi:FtsP/CotA-like multicopper oxidase with cupredoxin domain
VRIGRARGFRERGEGAGMMVREERHAGPRLARAIVLVVGLAWAVSCGDASRSASYVAPEFAEPVTLSSVDGVLEVSLFARQGIATLNTVATPVSNFLLFGYELQRGTASNGQASGANLYPAPTLRVNPGETLIVHVVNELADLTIGDLYDPAYAAAGEPVPLYPRQLTSSPFNLHTHGLHVSPRGNADNVLLRIPPGYTNTYTYEIPADHPQGLYWYHSHLHTLTAQHTYLGLAGLLSIGRPDGGIPAVTDNALPIRTMAIQYNFVFDRAGGQAILNDPNWPAYVSTLDPPVGSELADGTYVPTMTPLNFWQSKEGTEFVTIWWDGPLTKDNERGQFEFVPGNLQSFVSDDGKRKVDAHPDLPDHLRDVQFTVNGLFQPSLRAKPGQTEIWVLANIGDLPYVRIRLTETATGRHPQIAIVGQDGSPYPEVQHPFTDDGTTLLIPPATRYAIAVTMPQEGDLVLEMPPAEIEAIEREGVLYTNNGTEQPPAVLGTVTVEPSAITFDDGFYKSPTQVLARVHPESGTGVTVPFVAGQPLGAHSSYVDLSHVEPAVERELTLTEGFDNTHASKDDPKAFIFELDDNAFPNTPMLQPRLGSVEQWSFVNSSPDEHPIHIHTNSYQVQATIDPLGMSTGVQQWGQENANLPLPNGDDHARLVVRSEFVDFTGAYVLHCHRMNHEDNGMMAFVNVISAVSSYAVAASGSLESDAAVRVYDGSSDLPIASLTPFPGFGGTVSVAMGDIDGDQVLDLIAGKGPGDTPEVVVYSGASSAGGAPFTAELLRFDAFDRAFRGGVSVAAAGIDGNASADNLIVAAGPGIESVVEVFSATLPGQLGAAPQIFASFSPYPGATSGVSVAAGMVDAESGRSSIVTAPGAGSPPQVKTFRFDLYRANTGAAAWCAPSDALPADVPRVTSDFLAFDASYLGGLSLSTGWVTASTLGGARSIVVAQDAAPGTVKLFSSGSALDGQPASYLESPDQHDTKVSFTEIASFAPFADAPASGVRAATTSTTSGADLLVSGLDAAGTAVRVRKYGLVRATPGATSLTPELLADVESSAGIVPSSIGGD